MLARLLPVLAFAILCATASGQDARAWAKGVVDKRVKNAEKAPEFPGGREWLNVSRPLTFAKELKGKVVILDF